MPIYEYECEKCDHSFRKLQKITSRKLRKCPECGEKALIKLIGRDIAARFKGPGFYCNDSKNK